MNDNRLKLSVPRLDDENYFSWARIMELVLKSNGLWIGHFDIEVAAAEALKDEEHEQRGNAQRQHAEWVQKDLSAMIMILTNIGDGQQYKTVGKETARALWEALKPATAADDVMRLEKELKALKLSHFENVKAMAKKIKSIWAALLAAGNLTTMKETDLVRSIVHGLPSTYRLNKVLMLHEIESGKELNLDSVLRQLESAEQGLKEEESCNGAKPGQSGFMAQQESSGSSDRRKPARRNKNIVCFYCEKKGHIASKCRKKKADKAKEKERANLASGGSPIAFTLTQVDAEPDDTPDLLSSDDESSDEETSSQTWSELPARELDSPNRPPSSGCLIETGEPSGSHKTKIVVENESGLTKTFLAEGGPIKSQETRKYSPSPLIVGKKESIDQHPTIRYCVLDSGATSHYSKADRRFFTNYAKRRVPISTAKSGEKMFAEGVGDLSCLVEDDEGNLHPVIFTQTLHVPNLGHDLLSMTAFLDAGAKIEVTARQIIIKKGNLRFSAVREGQQLYKVPLFFKNFAQHDSPTALSAISSGATIDDPAVLRLHERFGHVSLKRLQHICGDDELCKGQGISAETKQKVREAKEIICEACHHGKSTSKPLPKVSFSTTQAPLQLIHSDLNGPFSGQRGGYVELLGLLDDFSDFLCLYKMRDKAATSVLHYYKEFEARSFTVIGKHPAVLRSDNGGEYTADAFKVHLAKRGTKHEMSTPYKHGQNGKIMERAWRTTIEGGLAQLQRSGLAHAALPP